MNIASRFEPLTEPCEIVAIMIDGSPANVPAGITLAAALLGLTGDATRQTAWGESRAPYCMMGVCFDCLVEVDGTLNTQACMTHVRDGMIVKRQIGLRDLAQDDLSNA